MSFRTVIRDPGDAHLGLSIGVPCSESSLTHSQRGQGPIPLRMATSKKPGGDRPWEASITMAFAPGSVW